MISEALQHLKGIGPVRLARLQAAGIRSWSDILDDPERIPQRWRADAVEECQCARQALDSGDIRFFVDRFSARDKWRILSHFLDQTTFFDIETTGLEIDAAVTVIACWHRGQLRTFVEHENLDDFLHLLDDVRLLASFNGSTFDVPRVLDAFHIPQLPCPHLDLRWPSRHRGLTGSLKQISSRLGIRRPSDLTEVDGEMAVRWWHAWRLRGDAAARSRLIRYCASDVLLLLMLSHHLALLPPPPAEHLWQHLPESVGISTESSEARQTSDAVGRSYYSGAFGPGSPAILRGRRRLS